MVASSAPPGNCGFSKESRVKENTLYARPAPGDPLGCILDRKAILNGHFPKGRLKKKVEKRQEGEGMERKKGETEKSVYNTSDNS